MTIPPSTIVVHMIGQLNPGGLEKRTLELVEATKDAGIKHIICITSGLPGSLDPSFQELGVALRYIRIRRLSFIFRFWRMLSRDRVTALHSNLMYASGVPVWVAKLARVPIRVVQFQSDGAPSSGIFQSIRRRVLRLLISRYATRIVGLTPRNLDLAWGEDWRNDSRCEVVPTGVRVPPNATASTDLEELSAKKLILHVGRGELPTKNRSRAIDVFAKYREKNPQSELIFVGRSGRTAEESEQNLNRWRTRAKRFGVETNVHFLGERDDVLSLMLKADLLLFTSSLEGLPGVVLEALSCGVPVVSSVLPGTKFIQENTSGITLIPLSARNDEWAAELRQFAHKLSPEQREENMTAFAASRFNVNCVERQYRGLWRGDSA